MREECGYKGAQPYWDWTLDIETPDAFIQSPIFDEVLGFGGNGPWIPFNASDFTQPSAPLGDVPGRTGGGCITNGPFASIALRLGPGADLSGNRTSCLRRDFSPLIAAQVFDKMAIRHLLAQSDFGSFDILLDGDAKKILPPNLQQGSIHAGGHWSIGGAFGQITDLYVSPSDPLFYLHHANLDRVWWSWQVRRLEERLRDISGPLVFADYENEVAGNTTLSYVIDVGSVNLNCTVGEVMDVKGGTLSYGYDDLL